jgi:carboxyl-terminal processing protease
VFKVKVKRAKIVLKSVNSKIISYKGKKFGYIQISSVGEETYDEFKHQLDELLNKKVQGIILDLRGN